jgi:signal transduction histidine kinase
VPASRLSLAAWSAAGLVTLVGLATGVLALAAGDAVPWKPALLPVLWSVPGALVAGARGRAGLGWSMLAVAALFAGSGLATSWVVHGTGSPRLDALSVWYVDRLSALIVPAATAALVLLPDGALPSPGWRRPVAGLVGAQVLLVAVWSLARGPAAGPDATWSGSVAGLANPVGVLPSSWGGAVGGLDWALQLPLLLAVAAVAVRLRRAPDDVRRRLVVVLLALGVFVVVVVAGRAVWGRAGWAPVADAADVLASAFLATVLVATVLRRHVDHVVLVVQRAAVLALLGAGVAGAYVVAVGALAWVGPDLSRFGAGVVAAVVALVVEPLRARLQRGVDRLLDGDRRDPFAAVSRLADHAHRPLPPAGVLDAVARSVATSTRAAGVRVEAFGACVEVGEPVSSAAAMRVPLLSGEVAVGSMSVSPQPGRRWRSDEVSLLGELGRHAGLAVDSARLAEEVAEHHRAVVGAREEERRLLGRELHDDLGPTVAGLALQLGALRPLVRSDPETVVARLARLEETAATALADIRRVAHQLRPPVLDQVGLGSAVLAVAESLGLTVVEQVVEHDRLPAAVELAAYRIAAEALSNVARHAGSAGVRLEIRQAGGTLLVVVSDEGRGFSVGSAGLGLTTMRERAEELRGTLSVRRGEHGGTVVTAVLPLAVPQTRRLVPEEEP